MIYRLYVHFSEKTLAYLPGPVLERHSDSGPIRDWGEWGLYALHLVFCCLSRRGPDACMMELCQGYRSNHRLTIELCGVWRTRVYNSLTFEVLASSATPSSMPAEWRLRGWPWSPAQVDPSITRLVEGGCQWSCFSGSWAASFWERIWLLHGQMAVFPLSVGITGRTHFYLGTGGSCQ